MSALKRCVDKRGRERRAAVCGRDVLRVLQIRERDAG